jgi:hypothetical protein
MDLNPVFTSLTDFSHSINSPTYPTTLFNLSRIRLVHGWLADPQAERTYKALDKVRDYDAATTLIVGCDAVMGGAMVESVGAGGSGGVGEVEAGNGDAEGGAKSPEEREMIENGTSKLVVLTM